MPASWSFLGYACRSSPQKNLLLEYLTLKKTHCGYLWIWKETMLWILKLPPWPDSFRDSCKTACNSVSILTNTESRPVTSHQETIVPSIWCWPVKSTCAQSPIRVLTGHCHQYHHFVSFVLHWQNKALTQTEKWSIWGKQDRSGYHSFPIQDKI